MTVEQIQRLADSLTRDIRRNPPRLYQRTPRPALPRPAKRIGMADPLERDLLSRQNELIDRVISGEISLESENRGTG